MSQPTSTLHGNPPIPRRPRQCKIGRPLCLAHIQPAPAILATKRLRVLSGAVQLRLVVALGPSHINGARRRAVGLAVLSISKAHSVFPPTVLLAQLHRSTGRRMENLSWRSLLSLRPNVMVCATMYAPFPVNDITCRLQRTAEITG